MNRPIETSDHELMDRCRQGDARAFAELIHRWERPVGRMVAHLLGQRGDVEDLCQEVFVRVLRARERYRASHSFSTWIHRIALNVVRDARRRESRRPRTSADETKETAAAPSSDQAVEQAERAQLVEQSLAALEDGLREVLVLKHYGKLSFAEIAQATDAPLSTVKSRMQAGLRALRIELRRRGLVDLD